jgi:UDP-glucose 6-dehydrogenase
MSDTNRINETRAHIELVTFDISLGEVYPAEAMRAVDLEFICVRTPANPDGTCDLSQVEE